MYTEVKRAYAEQLPEELIPQAVSALLHIDSRWGSAVNDFPIWHPLDDFLAKRGVFANRPDFFGEHQQCFLNAILYCPYDDGEEIVEAVRSCPPHPYVTIGVEKLNAKLWHPDTTSVLVTCEWKFDVLIDIWRTFKLSKVAPLFLEAIQPDLFTGRSYPAMPWERFAHFALGEPCGKVSSLFLSKPEGQGLKKLWEAVCNTGMLRDADR